MPNTFKRNVLIAFGFSLVLLLLSSIASYISIQNLIVSAERVDHTNNVISELDNINIMLQEAESSQRGYLLSGDVLGLLKDWGLENWIDKTQLNPKAGNFAAAWVITKLTEPIRLAIAVAITPYIVRLRQSHKQSHEMDQKQ